MPKNCDTEYNELLSELRKARDRVEELERELAQLRERHAGKPVGGGRAPEDEASSNLEPRPDHEADRDEARTKRSPGGVELRVDERARIVDVDPELCRLLGRDASDLLGMDSSDFLQRFSVAGRMDVLELLTAAGQGVLECRCLNGDGQSHLLGLFVHLPGEQGHRFVSFLVKDDFEGRRAAKALRQSEAYLRAVFESTRDLVCARDREGRLVTYNSAFAAFVAEYFQVEAAVGLRTMDYLSVEDRERWERVLALVLEGETHIEDFQLGLDGASRWYTLTLTPILLDGVAIGTAEFTRETTQQREYEEIILRKAELLQKAERLARLGAWEWDLVEDVWTMSENWRSIHGYRRNGIDSGEMFKLAHPEDVPAVREALRRVREQGESYHLRHRVVRADNGEIRHVQAHGDAERCPESGAIVRLVGASQDITREVRSEERLLLANYALDASLSGVVFANMDGSIHYANPRCHEMFGYGPDESALGENLGSFFVNAGDAFRILERLRTSPRFQEEFQGKRKDGSTFVLELGAHLVLSPSGEPLCFMGSCMDVTARRQALEKLRESEERYESLTRNLQGIAFRGDMEYRPIYCRGAVEAITGYTERDFVSGRLTWDQLLHPEDRERIGNSEGNKRLWTHKGWTDSREYRILRKDGGLRWVREVIHNISDAEGRPAFVEGVALDVTERRQVEEALRESELRYRTLFEKYSEGVFLHDSQGFILDANQAAQEMTGYALEELRGMHPSDMLRAEEYESFARMLEIASQGGIYEAEHHCLRKDGGDYVAVAWCKEVAPGLIMAMLRDVTDELRREERLRLLNRAIEQSAESIMITDERGDIVYVNPYFTLLTGYSSEEALGNKPGMLRSGRHSQAFYEELWSTLTSGRTWRGEFLNLTKCGEEFWEEATISPVFNDQGEITHYVAVKEEITQRKRMEELKEDVARIIRHDMKTPLSGVVAISETLLEDEGLGAFQKRGLRLIQEAGRRMFDMIEISMTMFQIEEGCYSYRPVELDLLGIARQAMDQLRPLAESKNIEIHLLLRGFDEEEARAMVKGDRLLAFSVVANLLKNAIEASPENVAVTIMFWRDKDVVLEIHNRGQVPACVRERFFEKYVTAGKVGGTGLGAYSARLFASVQGWTLSMRSEERDGTLLTLRMSRAD